MKHFIDMGYKELHPNHQFLIDIRGRLIPNMCNNSNSCISFLESEMCRRKLKLCEEQLHVMNTIDPGFSIARGKLLIELQQTKLKLGKFILHYYFGVNIFQRIPYYYISLIYYILIFLVGLTS